MEKKTYTGLPVVSVHLDVDYCLLSEKPIRTAKETIEFVGEKIYDNAVEKAYAIFMDDTLCPICVASVGTGTGNGVSFSIRDIVQTAMLSNASYVTILHNHPGVNLNKRQCKPSREDVIVTDSIIKACRYIGVTVYDSIIATGYKKTVFGHTNPVYYSMKQHSYDKLRRKYGLKDEPLPDEESDLQWELEGSSDTPHLLSDKISYLYGMGKQVGEPDFDYRQNFEKLLTTQLEEKSLSEWFTLPPDKLKAFEEMENR